MSWTTEQRKQFHSLVNLMAINAERDPNPDQMLMYEAACCIHDFEKVCTALRNAIRIGQWYTIEKIELEIGVIRVKYTPPPPVDSRALVNKIRSRKDDGGIKALPLTEDVETGFWIFRCKTPPGMQERQLNDWMAEHVDRLQSKGWIIVDNELKDPFPGKDSVWVNQGGNSFMQERECWIWSIPAIRHELLKQPEDNK